MKVYENFLLSQTLLSFVLKNVESTVYLLSANQELITFNK